MWQTQSWSERVLTNMKTEQGERNERTTSVFQKTNKLVNWWNHLLLLFFNFLTFWTEWPISLRAHHECEFFLEVQPAEELSVFDDELVALLQLVSARRADETDQMVDMSHCTHHQFIRRYHLMTTCALCTVISANAQKQRNCKMLPIILPLKGAEWRSANIAQSVGCKWKVYSGLSIQPRGANMGLITVIWHLFQTHITNSSMSRTLWFW